MTDLPRAGAIPEALVLGAGGPLRPKLSRFEAVAVWVACLLLFVEHLAFGADRIDVALWFVVGQTLLLCGLVAAAPWARDALAATRPLGWPAAFLGLVVLVC